MCEAEAAKQQPPGTCVATGLQCVDVAVTTRRLQATYVLGITITFDLTAEQGQVQGLVSTLNQEVVGGVFANYAVAAGFTGGTILGERRRREPSGRRAWVRARAWEPGPPMVGHRGWGRLLHRQPRWGRAGRVALPLPVSGGARPSRARPHSAARPPVCVRLQVSSWTTAAPPPASPPKVSTAPPSGTPTPTPASPWSSLSELCAHPIC